MMYLSHAQGGAPQRGVPPTAATRAFGGGIRCRLRAIRRRAMRCGCVQPPPGGSGLPTVLPGVGPVIMYQTCTVCVCVCVRARGQVRVRVVAAGVTTGDLRCINARRPAYPVAPGLDVAGIVDSVGTDVTGFEIGDRVRSARCRPASPLTGAAGGVGDGPDGWAVPRALDVLSKALSPTCWVGWVANVCACAAHCRCTTMGTSRPSLAASQSLR
jgi:hypothetical protein